MKSAVREFLRKSVDEAWAKEILLGQFKINENLAHIAERGYGIRVDSAGKFDNWFRAPETRGRIERADDLKARKEKPLGKLQKALIEMYNYGAFFAIETGSVVAPRIFDMTGNNISFRGANTAARIMDARLKKMHSLYGDRIWKWYNEPDVAFDLSLIHI